MNSAYDTVANGHYHLGVERSTLAEASVRWRVAVFADPFAQLAPTLDRKTRREGAEMLRLIDSTLIPLSKFHEFARSTTVFVRRRPPYESACRIRHW